MFGVCCGMHGHLGQRGLGHSKSTWEARYLLASSPVTRMSTSQSHRSLDRRGGRSCCPVKTACGLAAACHPKQEGILGGRWGQRPLSDRRELQTALSTHLHAHVCVCVRVCAQPLTSNTKRRLKIPASRETSVLLRPAGRETERSENQHKHPRAVGARQPALRRNPRCRIESISTITDNAKTPKAL